MSLIRHRIMAAMTHLKTLCSYIIKIQSYLGRLTLSSMKQSTLIKIGREIN